MQAIRQDGTPHKLLGRASAWLDGGGRLAHVGLVTGLGLFIVLGPAAGQIFGQHQAYLREWTMFSGAGIGVLKGRFTLHRASEADRQLTPLEFLGLRTYPDAPPDQFDRLVLKMSDLKRDAAALCDGQPEGSRLSFKGWVGTRLGWRALAVEDVCALPAPEIGNGSPAEEPLL